MGPRPAAERHRKHRYDNQRRRQPFAISHPIDRSTSRATWDPPYPRCRKGEPLVALKTDYLRLIGVNGKRSTEGNASQEGPLLGSDIYTYAGRRHYGGRVSIRKTYPYMTRPFPAASGMLEGVEGSRAERDTHASDRPLALSKALLYNVLRRRKVACEHTIRSIRQHPSRHDDLP